MLNTSWRSAAEPIKAYIKRGMWKLTMSAYINMTFSSYGVYTYSYIISEDLIQLGI